MFRRLLRALFYIKGWIGVSALGEPAVNYDDTTGIDRRRFYIAQPNGYSCAPTSLTEALFDFGASGGNSGLRFDGATYANPNTRMSTRRAVEKALREPQEDFGSIDDLAAYARQFGLATIVHFGPASGVNITPENVEQAMALLDSALAAGHGVLINVPHHFVYCVGKTAGGLYIMGDPADPRTALWDRNRMANEMDHTYDPFDNNSQWTPTGFVEVWNASKPVHDHIVSIGYPTAAPGLDWKGLPQGQFQSKRGVQTAGVPGAVSPATGDPNGTWVCDLTGPQLTNGVTCTDLGEPVCLPDGRLIFFFGDTFSGARVGQGDWRSPVALIGKWDLNPAHAIVWDVAAGADPKYARQLIPYTHDGPPDWSQGGISTKIPSDAIVINGVIYLHVIPNHGFGNVPKTEIWSSSDNGVSWRLVTDGFAGNLHNGFAQLWSWDYCPEDGYIYVVSTGFQRDKGVILRRVRPGDIGAPAKYEGWGWSAQNSQWAWGNEPTIITPEGETWGELSFRRIGKNRWILGGLVLSRSGLGYRVLTGPTDNLHVAPLQMPVLGSTWADNDPPHGKVAQVYGGFVLPGAQLDVEGGVGLVVSQWNTDIGWPYKAMQFRATIHDTTAVSGV